MTKQTVDQKIDEVIAALSSPVSEAEAMEGWTPASKMAIRTYFANLRHILQTGECLPPLDICRGMDHWGVVGGPILEKAAQISNELRLRRSV